MVGTGKDHTIGLDSSLLNPRALLGFSETDILMEGERGVEICLRCSGQSVMELFS